MATKPCFVCQSIIQVSIVLRIYNFDCELTWHLSAPHKGISKRTYLLKPSKKGSPEFQAVFSLLCRSFSLSINPRLVIMSSTLGSFANYIDKILTHRPTTLIDIFEGEFLSVIMENLHTIDISSGIYIRMSIEHHET